MAKITDFPEFNKILNASQTSPEAQTIYNYFAPKYGDETAKKMVVLSNYESGWNTGAGAYTPYEKSVGLFQINAPVHNQRISKYSGTTDTKTNLEWLKNPVNNLKVAEDLFKEQGFRPWTASHKSIAIQGGGYAGNRVADLATLESNDNSKPLSFKQSTPQKTPQTSSQFGAFLNSLPDTMFGGVNKVQVIARARQRGLI